MNHKYSKCNKCPAFHLLTEERKGLIERWENRRDRYLSRTKNIRLILLGESMPASRYFYDIETEYEDNGLRFTLKKEFGKLELSDSLFLTSMARKGIVLYDCALCPLHALKKNAHPDINTNNLRRHSATYCFLSLTMDEVAKHKDVPIATIFPCNMGWLKKEIPSEIKNRIVGEFGFSDQIGLAELYEKIKSAT